MGKGLKEQHKKKSGGEVSHQPQLRNGVAACGKWERKVSWSDAMAVDAKGKKSR